MEQYSKMNTHGKAGTIYEKDPPLAKKKERHSDADLFTSFPLRYRYVW